MHTISTQTLKFLSRHWIGSLSGYRGHRHGEHVEALVTEALRYAGLRLETDLSHSKYWRDSPLIRRAAVLLFLVDRNIVQRNLVDGRYEYEPTSDAERWVASQPSLAAYLVPTLELIAALRRLRGRRLPIH